ncbi:MAG TPA: hypothetical protein PKY82_32850 [Pyrinomonadaceae bacterium]|nr:hypothetical protein [Pyrinomonadaceae bacterium]
MHCPTCGQQQINNEIRFCSRCGFLLSDVAEVVANNGISPYKTPGRISKKDSPRKRGIKQGAMVMLVGCLLIVPIISILMPFLGFPPFFIPIAAVSSFMGGLLRIIYALMFEEKEAIGFFPESNVFQPQAFQNQSNPKSLPANQSIPASVYAPPTQGSWMETNDLVQPPSVTESTTKLLQKDE